MINLKERNPGTLFPVRDIPAEIQKKLFLDYKNEAQTAFGTSIVEKEAMS